MTERRTLDGNYVLYGIGMLFGVGMALWGFIVLERQKASFQWPTTSGTIVHSERVLESGGERPDYRANVTYRYNVNGSLYLSHQISLWNADLRDYGEASKTFVLNHPDGSSVDVYYDPSNPANAVLIPGSHKKLNELLMGAGGIIIILGIAGVIEQRGKDRKRLRLAAVLNAPNAGTRTVQIRKAGMGVESGMSIVIYFMIAMALVAFGLAILIPPFLAGPDILLEGRHQTSPWQFVWGIGCLGGFVFFAWLGGQKLQGRVCPVCGHLLDKMVFSPHKCGRCGTQFIFEGEKPPDNSETVEKAETAIPSKPVRTVKETRHGTVISGFEKDRFLDVAGFMAFPIVFLWLWAGTEKHWEGGAVIFTILFSMQGCLYYFYPKRLLKMTGKRSSKSTSETDDGETGPYLLDLSIILSPAVGLLCYLVYLVWRHQVLDVKGLIGLIIVLPAAIWIVHQVCKARFTRSKELKLPKQPVFVASTVLALWLLGTFIWVVFVVCLIFKLVAQG